MQIYIEKLKGLSPLEKLAGLFLYCGRTRQEDHTDRAGQKGGHDLCVCIGRTAAGEGNGYSERQAGCR